MPRGDTTVDRKVVSRALKPLFALLVGIVLLATVHRRYWSDAHDPYKCSVLLNEGQWLDEPIARPARRPFQKWQPPGCMLKEYQADEITHCAGDRQLLFIGDSNVRQLFWAVAKKLDHDSSLQAGKYAERHGDIQLRPRGVDLRFVWDPYLNGSILANELEIYQESITPTRNDGKSEVPAVMLVIGGGLWHARQFDVGAVREFKSVVDGITKLSQRRDGSEWKSKSPFNGWEGIGDQVFFVPVEEPFFKRLSPSRQVTIMPDEIDQMNDYLRQLDPSQGLTIPWVNQIMTSKRPFAYEASGLHVIEPIVNRRADVILNLRCNAKVDNAVGSPYDRTCCSRYTSGNWFQWVLVALSMTIFSIGALYTRHAKGGLGLLSPIVTPAASIGLPLVYSFLADRTQLFNKVQKVYYRSEFLTLCGIALAVGLLTIRRSKESLPRKNSPDAVKPQSYALLSRDQIEEWRGWMMVIILLYHWTGASKQMWIYVTVRVLIASYLFIVGYEHTLYLYENSDYSIRRVAVVLLRLNILGVALSYQMYTNYLFYYFAPLLSFWFLAVYATLRFGAQLNDNIGFLLGKIVIFASLIVLLHKNDQPIDFVFAILRTLFGINWDARDWRFQVSLDPFIVYVGMLVALLNIAHRSIRSSTETNYAHHYLSTLYSQIFPHLRITAILAAVVALPAFYVWMARVEDQDGYNWYQPLISPLPILSFVVLRNAFPVLRAYHSLFFAWLGRCSVEAFALSYHMWLAADAKGVLSLGIFRGNGTLSQDRWRDFLLLTPVFLVAAWCVSQACEEVTWLVVGDGTLENLPVAVVKEKEAVADGRWRPRSGCWGGWLRLSGVRFALVLGGLWVLNLATG